MIKLVAILGKIEKAKGAKKRAGKMAWTQGKISVVLGRKKKSKGAKKG